MCGIGGVESFIVARNSVEMRLGLSRRIQRWVEDRWRTGVARQVFRGAIPVRQMEGREDEIVRCSWVFQDVRFGLRLLRREPGVAATMVLTWRLRSGVTTTIFWVVDAVLLQQQPFLEPEIRTTATDPWNRCRRTPWTGRERATSFERMAASSRRSRGSAEI